MNTTANPIDNDPELKNPATGQGPEIATIDSQRNQAPSDAEETAQCPDCGSTTPWRMSSWCPDCGYYPAIDARVNGDNEVKEVVEEVVESNEPKPWPFLKKMNVGIFSIFAFTLFVRIFYHYADADRGLWTLIQSVSGLLVAGGAQALTAIYASKENQQYSLLSAVINPIDVWSPSFQKNVFQNRLCALIWGATATILAFAMIGGLTQDHFFKAFEQNKAQFNVLEEIVNATNGITGDEEVEEPNMVGALTDEESIDELNADNKNIINCAVYGYMTSGGETITRILLAAPQDDELKHVGILTAEQLGEDKTAALTNILLTLEMPSTDVETSFSATWVDPSFTISIQHDGFDAFGNLKNVRLPEEKEEETEGDTEEDS